MGHRASVFEFQCSVYDLYNRGGDIDQHGPFHVDHYFPIAVNIYIDGADYKYRTDDFTPWAVIHREFSCKLDDIHRADDVSGRPDDFIVGHLTSSDPGDIDNE